MYKNNFSRIEYNRLRNEQIYDRYDDFKGFSKEIEKVGNKFSREENHEKNFWKYFLRKLGNG